MKIIAFSKRTNMKQTEDEKLKKIQNFKIRFLVKIGCCCFVTASEYKAHLSDKKLKKKNL